MDIHVSSGIIKQPFPLKQLVSCFVFDLARRGSTSGFLYLWLAAGLGLAKSTCLCFIIVINLILCRRYGA